MNLSKKKSNKSGTNNASFNEKRTDQAANEPNPKQRHASVSPSISVSTCTDTR